MRRALDETERRRNKQIEYNREHGITPTTISKAVADVMQLGQGGGRKLARVAEEIGEYAALSPDALARKIKALEDRMYAHARDLEFEEAARVRDQIKRIQDASLELSV